jgi:type II secretory pathway predicted ATPase ExeA
MMLQAFGMTRDPFDRDIDVPDLFESSGLRELDARLHYLIDIQAIGLFTGEIGSGKTTAVRRLLESLHPGLYKPLYVCPATVSAIDFYRAIALAFGIEPKYNRVRLYYQIRDEIERLSGVKKLRPVLVIDEAHLLRNDVLDGLRLLTNFRMDSANLLTIVLVGQTEFRRKLQFSAHEAFAQRIAVRYHLDGIKKTEISDFLAHQLRRAGVHNPLFTEAAIEALFQASRGALRLINHLARQSLIAAAAARAPQADTEHVRLAVTESE